MEWLVIRIRSANPFHARRVALLPIQRIHRDRFMRLIMRRHRPIFQAVRRKQPALAIAIQNERIVPRNSSNALGILRRAIRRVTVRNEIRHIVSSPLLLPGIPPNIFLTLRPRVAFRVRRSPVIKDAPVRRPRPSPILRHPILFLPRLPVRRLVLTTLIGP